MSSKLLDSLKMNIKSKYREESSSSEGLENDDFSSKQFKKNPIISDPATVKKFKKSITHNVTEDKKNVTGPKPIKTIDLFKKSIT